MPIDPRMPYTALDIPDYTGDRIRRASALQQEAAVQDLLSRRQKQQKLDSVLQKMGPRPTPEGIAEIYKADPATGLGLMREYDAEQNRIRDDERAQQQAIAEQQRQSAQAEEAARKEQFRVVQEREKANAVQLKADEEKQARDQLAKFRQGAVMVNDLDPDDIVGWRMALESMTQSGLADEEDAAQILQADSPTRAAYRKKIVSQALGMDEVGLRQLLTQKEPAPPQPRVMDSEIDLRRTIAEANQPGATLEQVQAAKVATETLKGMGKLGGGGDVKPPSKGAYSGLDPKQATRVGTIANQFDNEPSVRRWQTAREGLDFVNNMGGAATDDQALIYAFAKAMDPDSVVREGEYSTVRKYSQSWANQFGFQAARIFTNSQFLSDEARKQMKETIKSKAKAQRDAYKRTEAAYAGRIKNQEGLDDGARFLTRYDTDLGDAKPPSAQGAPTGVPKVGDTIPGLGVVRSIKKKGQ